MYYKSCYCLAFYFLLCAIKLNAQQPPVNSNYRYCYSPHNKTEVSSNGDIIFYVSSFDEKDLTKTFFTVTKKDGSEFSNEKIVFTLGQPYPSGKILDISLNGSSARITYTSFMNEKDSVRIYANRTNHDIMEVAGPVTIYSSGGKNNFLFQVMCELKNNVRKDTSKHVPKQSNANNGGDIVSKIVISTPGPKQTVIKTELLKNFICPNNDVLNLIDAYNPSISGNSTLQAGTVVNLPPFPAVSSGQKEKYAEQFFWDNDTDSTQSELFLQRSNNIINLIASLIRNNLSNAKSEADSLKNVLSNLSAVIKEKQDIAYNIRMATAQTVNDELNSISFILTYQTPKNINMGSYNADNELLKAYTQDIEDFLSSYTSAFIPKHDYINESFASARGPQVFLDMNEIDRREKHFADGDNGLRQIYFRIIKYDAEGNPVTADSVVGGRYRIYCVSRAEYFKFKMHNKDINIISAAACQDLASTSSKNLAGTVYNFIAVLADTNEIVNDEGSWNIGTITKDNADQQHPYSYTIKVTK